MTERNKTKVLFLIDWHKDEEWTFWKTFPTDNIEYDVLGMRFPKGTKFPLAKVIFVWSRYLLVGLLSFLRRKNYDVVVAWQQVEGLVFGFLKNVFKCKTPKLIIMELLFRRRENIVNDFIRFKFTKKALTAVDLIGCSNSRLIDIYAELFKFNKNRFRFIPSITGVRENPMFYNGSVGNYIFSAGRSSRDYKTLVEAVRDLDTELIIITEPTNLKGIPLPSNVRVRYNVFGSEFTETLKKAKFIVLSLDNPDVSAGQMVLWESMSWGKAVIITQGGGVIDYVKDNVEVKFVRPHNVEDLRAAIEELLSNPEQVTKLGMNAIQSINSKYGWKPFSKEVAKLISEVCHDFGFEE